MRFVTSTATWLLTVIPPQGDPRIKYEPVDRTGWSSYTVPIPTRKPKPKD